MIADLPRVSEKLTQGSLLCLAEAMLSLLLVYVPPNTLFYFAGLGCAVFLLVAALRFKDEKLGVDVSELCLYEVFIWGIALTCYINYIDPTPFRAVVFAIAPLKLLRIFFTGLISQSNSENGWSIFGPITYFHARKNGNNVFKFENYTYLWGVLIVSGMSWYYLPTMDTIKIICALFAIPLGYLFANGPQLLSETKNLVTRYTVSIQHVAEKDDEILRIKQENEALKRENDDLKRENNTLRQMQSAPKKHHTDLIEAYESTKPERQWHLVKIAQGVARQFAKQPKT